MKAKRNDPRGTRAVLQPWRLPVSVDHYLAVVCSLRFFASVGRAKAAKLLCAMKSKRMLQALQWSPELAAVSDSRPARSAAESVLRGLPIP